MRKIVYGKYIFFNITIRDTGFIAKYFLLFDFFSVSLQRENGMINNL